jgi:hypothetical protein
MVHSISSESDFVCMQITPKVYHYTKNTWQKILAQLSVFKVISNFYWSKRLYNSLRWLVRWLVGSLVGPFVSPHIASPREISRLVCFTTCFLKLERKIPRYLPDMLQLDTHPPGPSMGKEGAGPFPGNWG